MLTPSLRRGRPSEARPVFRCEGALKDAFRLNCPRLTQPVRAEFMHAFDRATKRRFTIGVITSRHENTPLPNQPVLLLAGRNSPGSGAQPECVRWKSTH